VGTLDSAAAALCRELVDVVASPHPDHVLELIGRGFDDRQPTGADRRDFDALVQLVALGVSGLARRSGTSELEVISAAAAELLKRGEDADAVSFFAQGLPLPPAVLANLLPFILREVAGLDDVAVDVWLDAQDAAARPCGAAEAMTAMALAIHRAVVTSNSSAGRVCVRQLQRHMAHRLARHRALCELAAALHAEPSAVVSESEALSIVGEVLDHSPPGPPPVASHPIQRHAPPRRTHCSTAVGQPDASHLREAATP
jgi:hypothetical protein